MKKTPLKTASAFLCACLLCVTPLTAQQRLKHPLTFVPADSVVVWGEGVGDVRGAALRFVQDAASRTVDVSKKSVKAAERRFSSGESSMQSIVGVSSGETSKAQVPSLQVDALSERATLLVADASTLLAATGEAVYAEIVERVLFNDLAHIVRQTRGANYAASVASRTIHDAIGRVYATCAGALYVNLFTNSTTNIPCSDFNLIVDQITAMPLSGRVKIRLNGFPHNGYPLRLYIRQPHWAEGEVLPGDTHTLKPLESLVSEGGEGSAKPLVNGRDVLNLTFERGYAVIDRSWNNGDEILVDFPLPVLAASRAESSEIALLRGPIAYAAPAASNFKPKLPLLVTDEDEALNGAITLRLTDAQGRTLTAEPYLTSPASAVWFEVE